MGSKPRLGKELDIGHQSPFAQVIQPNSRSLIHPITELFMTLEDVVANKGTYEPILRTEITSCQHSSFLVLPTLPDLQAIPLRPDVWWYCCPAFQRRQVEVRL